MSDKLVKCRKCKKEVNLKDKECPHCGTKDPGVSNKAILITLAVIVGIVYMFMSSDKANYENYKDTTISEAKELPAGSIKLIAESYVEDSGLPQKYGNKFYNCLGQLIYEKDNSLTIGKMLEWCKSDYDNTPNNEMEQYYNSTELLSDFSLYDGSYKPLEDMIKEKVVNYDHVETKYSFVYYGTSRPYMLVKTTFKGNNALGNVVTTTMAAKVDAVTKEIFELN